MLKIGELLRKLWSLRSCFLILPPGALTPQGIEGAIKRDMSKHWCTLQWCASRGCYIYSSCGLKFCFSALKFTTWILIFQILANKNIPFQHILRTFAWSIFLPRLIFSHIPKNFTVTRLVLQLFPYQWKQPCRICGQINRNNVQKQWYKQKETKHNISLCLFWVRYMASLIRLS